MWKGLSGLEHDKGQCLSRLILKFYVFYRNTYENGSKVQSIKINAKRICKNELSGGIPFSKFEFCQIIAIKNNENIGNLLEKLRIKKTKLSNISAACY